jgi:hypothetical protein
MKIDGGCHCGKIAFEAEVDPGNVWLCHCTDCQTLSGSAFLAVIETPAASFKLLTGQPKVYIKTVDSGEKQAHGFCGDCGTPVYGSAVTNPQSYSLRIGTIRQRAALRSPQGQIWCRSALPWAMNLPGIEKRQRQ